MCVRDMCLGAAASRRYRTAAATAHKFKARRAFSKVLSIVTLDYKSTRALTRQKVCQARAKTVTGSPSPSKAVGCEGA